MGHLVFDEFGLLLSHPGDPVRERQAYEAFQQAGTLSANGPQDERAYISALSKRFCACPNPDRQKQAVEFKDAMHDLTQAYPDDLDAATLYAQSITNLSPWDLWNLDGTPREGTPEVLSVLESVLKRDPHHLGAIHSYIHALEASPNPERALVYANLLPSLSPPVGHLIHMPAHIYVRTGDYLRGEEACAKPHASMMATFKPRRDVHRAVLPPRSLFPRHGCRY